KNTSGWWKLQDPIKNWGDSLLAKIGNPEQEIGLLWVCVKSGKSYNAHWDLTKGATVSVVQAGSSNVISASPPPIRSDAPLGKMSVLFDGKSLDGWEFNSNAWAIAEG